MPNTPSSFIVQAEDDPVHVENAVVYFMALKNAKVPAELHIYAQGGHGYGLRRTELPVTTWPQRVEDWLHTIKVLPRAVGAKINFMLLAILTVSDRCSQGQAIDTAGPAVAALLRQNWPEAEVRTALVPDEEEAIVQFSRTVEP